MLGISIAITSTIVSLDGLGANGFPQFFGQSSWLDAIDLISEGILMPLGAVSYTHLAFNALLKTLEEPPEHVMFILATTEPQKLPSTILSRCMRLDFRRVPQPVIAENMKNICNDRGIELTEDAARLLANCADGSVRDGLSILDQVLAGGDKKVDRDKVLEYVGTTGEDFFIELTELVSLKKSAEAIVLLNEVLQEGKDVRQIMKDWVEHYRGCLLYTSRCV